MTKILEKQFEKYRKSDKYKKALSYYNDIINAILGDAAVKDFVSKLSEEAVNCNISGDELKNNSNIISSQNYRIKQGICNLERTRKHKVINYFSELT